jgi:hypothetical protein
MTWQSDLHDLRFHWGETYRICSDGKVWTASPHEHPTNVLTAASAGELRRAIVADYQGRPVGEAEAGQSGGPDHNPLAAPVTTGKGDGPSPGGGASST